MTQLTTRETRLAEWSAQLNSPRAQAEFKRALRTSMPPATVARIVLNCLSTDDKLQQCTKQSVLRAVVTALALGLEPNNVLGEAHLVPHAKECVLYIGYGGFTKLAFNTGKIGKVEAFNVYSNERFTVDYGADQEIHHEPLPPSTRGDFIASWCKVPMTTGYTSYTLMWHEEIEAIRKESPMGTKGPWAHPYQVGEMRKKTVVKRACKLLPRSPIDPLQLAVALDNQADAGQSQDLDMIDIEPVGAAEAAPQRQTLNDLTEQQKTAAPVSPVAGELEKLRVRVRELASAVGMEAGQQALGQAGLDGLEEVDICGDVELLRAAVKELEQAQLAQVHKEKLKAKGKSPAGKPKGAGKLPLEGDSQR